MGKKRNHDHSASREEKKKEDLVERIKAIVTNIDRRYKKRYRSRSPHRDRRDRSRNRHRKDGDCRRKSDRHSRSRSRSRHSIGRSRRSSSRSRHSRRSERSRSNHSRRSGRSRSDHSQRSGHSRSREMDYGPQQSSQESEGEREESQILTQKNDEVIVNEQLPAGPSAPETTAPVITEQQASVTAQNQPEHEADLQEDVLNVIGPRLEPDQKKAPSLHKDIVIRWMEIFKKGLSKEESKSLGEKYNIPENCGFIVAPVLNSEVVAAIQDNVKTRDKRITEKQERIASCMAAMGKAISITLKSDSREKLELLEILSDTGRLLAFLQREESEIRRSLILANLNSSVREILTCSTVDGFLFGADLEEKIKTAKTIERASKDLVQPGKPSKLKESKNQKGPPAQRQLTRKKNWTPSGPKRPTNDKYGSRPGKTYPRKSRFPDRRR